MKRLTELLPRGNRLTVVLAIGLVLMFGWFLFDRLAAEQRAILSQENAAQFAAEVRAACDRQGETARELGDICRQARAVEEDPAAPIPGIDGRDGRDGTDGIDGRDGRDGRPGRAGLDGRDGRDGQDGSDGIGVDGRDGRDGTDGAGIDGQDGQRGLTCVEELGLEECRGEPGKDGKDGKDGEPGKPGPDCPDGATVTLVWVRASQIQPPPPGEFVQAWVCLAS